MRAFLLDKRGSSQTPCRVRACLMSNEAGPFWKLGSYALYTVPKELLTPGPGSSTVLVVFPNV